MTTFTSVVITDPRQVPTVRMGGGGNLPVVEVTPNLHVQLISSMDAPAYLREWAASLLHLAGLAESAELDRSMATVVASDPSHGRAS